MYINKFNYKGFLVYENISDKFHTTYWSVFNPRNNCHCHSTSEGLAKEIVDCFLHNFSIKYSRITRNKAMRLNGLKMLA